MSAVESHPMPYRLTPLAKAHLKALSPLKEGKEKEIFSSLGMSHEEIDELLRKQAKVRTFFKEFEME